MQFFINKITVIQLRRRGTEHFELLKKFFYRKFNLIVEIEGFPEFEFNYLETHSYKEGFYSENIKFKSKSITKFNKDLLNADHIICVSENLKKLIMSKYMIKRENITALTTGCDSNIFMYNEKTRIITREKLGLKNRYVIIFVGSLWASWQNISRTLEVFKIIKHFDETASLIIITNESDKPIMMDFINKHNINPSEIILEFSIPNEKIPQYLNAADLAIILREDHPMNNVAAPGKFGEYACCGLPILTGKGIADFSEKLEKKGYGIVLNDIYDNSEFIEKYNKFRNEFENIDRKEISKWGAQNFSYQAYINKYRNLMKMLLQS